MNPPCLWKTWTEGRRVRDGWLEAVERRDLLRLREILSAMQVDRRAVLVAAGMVNGDWREVLEKQRFAVPAAPPGQNEA